VSLVPLRDEPLPPGRLDDVDRAIIEQLQTDGRAPFGSVAARVGTSEDDVGARVEALLSEGVIDIVAVTDPLQLGYPRQAMLGILTDAPSQPIGEEVARIEEVIYQARTTGGFDLLVEVVGTSDAHLLELVTRIRRIPGVTRIHTFLYQELVKETYAYGAGSSSGGGSAS
jgi:Lrp/AsnC family transcriptional regulator for asnA, asnC and gidA